MYTDIRVTGGAAAPRAGRAALSRAALALVFAAVIQVASARADVITDWNEIGNTAAVINSGKPAAASVIDLTYMHAAMYDAVNAVDGRYTPYAVRVKNVPAGASKEAAAVAAAYTVLRAVLPAQQSFLDAKYAQSIATIGGGQGKIDGIALGEIVANRLLELRDGDGRNAAVTYTPSPGPGVWQPTPPAFAAAQTPWVAQMKPFALMTPSQFRAPLPPALSGEAWAADFDETRRLGAVNSTERTPEQTEMARFYAEHTGTQYARAFRDFAQAQSLSLDDDARLFAVIYVTLSDALIATWDSKYHYGFWRPVTAVRAADTDGNPATEADAGWTPLLTTPNHPEYPAAHGVFTAAYAEALRRFFGTKRVPLRLTSAVTGTARPFDNTDDVIKEIIEARIYGGLHYRTSCHEGVEIGKKVAKWVARRYFLPANQALD